MATEKVGIEIELMNAESAYNTLRKIDETVKNIGRKKTMIKLDDGSLVSIDDRIKEIQDRLAALGAAKKLRLLSGDEADEMNRLNAELKILQRGLKDGTANARTFAQAFNSISSKVAHIGSAMQSFGNAMTTLTSPFARLTDGIIFGAGYKVLNQFTEGIENGFERADVMRKYPRIMQNLGYSAKEAQDSIDKLDKSVLGLPTSLVDMVSMSQRFTSTMGDLSKGTDLAIAANNAFLASMSTEQQKYQGMMQLQDVIGGKKMNSREWYSLANSMMPAIRMMGESLGYTGDALDDYVAKVSQGKIANEEFIKTLIAAGTDENGKIRKVALESLDTWEAFFSRIKTAASKFMWKGIIEPMNELVKTVTKGKFESLNLFLDDLVYNRIDKAGQAVKEWIQAHPEEITQFFKDLKSVDWKGLVNGFVKGLGFTIKALQGVSKVMSKFGMGWLGWIFGAGRGIGKASTIIGGLLKGTRHLWAITGILGKIIGSKIGKLFTGKFGGSLGKIGIFGKIASLFGKKKAIDEAGDVAASVTKASPKLISAFKNMALLSGIIAIPSLTAWGVTASAKASVKNFREIIDTLKGVDWRDAAKVLGGIAAYLGGSAIAGGLVGKLVSTKPDIAAYTIIGETVLGVITGIASAFFNFDMSQISKGLKNFADAVKSLNEIPDIGDADALFDKVKNAIDVMNRITGLLNGEAPEVVTAGNIGRNGGLEGMGWFKSSEIGNLSKALKALAEMGKSLNEIATVEIPEGIEDKAVKLATVASSVAKALGDSENGFGGGIPIFKNIGTASIDGVMKSIADELIQLRRMAYHLNALASVSVPANAETKAKILIHTMSRIATELGSSFSGIGTGLIKRNMTNVANQLYQLRRMAYHINKLASTDLNTGGFSAFIESLKTALTDLQSLAGLIELDIEVKLSDKFGTSVTNAVNEIKKGKDKIKKQKSGVSFTIPVSVTFSVTTNFGAALAGIINQKNELSSAGSGGTSGNTSGNTSGRTGHKSRHQRLTGGYIYRANGGAVGFPGKPQGADRIPVWASAGEYIHNKRAVNTFGIDFMRKVNNLDVKGAMNELMHRAGGMANVNRGVSITNNNYNNQKVTINNSNNAGAGFTFKSASRFVGAF